MIGGLQLLEKGEVLPFLAAKKVKARGRWPATVRERRLKAIGAVKALRNVGYSVEKAVEIVAEAHGRVA